jgi:ribosomal protein S18 acetylase RimI-like enzyme
MSMNIRVYRDDDFNTLVALWSACGLDHAPNDPALDIPILRASKHGELFLAFEEDLLLGSVMIGHDGHRAWIYRLAVRSDRRHRHIGRALVHHAEGWAAMRGLRKVQLMIRDTNTEVQTFYAKLGYEVSPRTVMARWLEPGDREKVGKIEVVVNLLEMTQRPAHQSVAVPEGKTALLKAEKMPVRFFRYLYAGVGDPWFWYYRRYLDDAEIAAIIHDPRVEIYVLYIDGSPAGYVEIDRRIEGEVTINHLGLMMEFIGKGLGPYLLAFAIDAAWQSDPKRVLIETCTLDHPSALPLYQKAGFHPIGQRTEFIDDPRMTGHLPSHLDPRLP